MNVVKSLRNHWKKSIFLVGACAYGSKYLKKKLEDDKIRKLFCESANEYGHEHVKLTERPRRATVFLNPAASEGTGRKLFEKNAAPILYLSGTEINLVKTEYEGQAKEFMGVLEAQDTDLIVVAGGDGLLAEVVSGIMKKNSRSFEKAVPLAVIPVGKTNRFFRLLFGADVLGVENLCQAAITVLNGQPRKVDVMEIMGADGKKTYALTGIESGSYRDAKSRCNKYWYFGPLKSRWTYVRTLMKSWPPSTTAHISYVTAEKADALSSSSSSVTKQVDTAKVSTASKSWRNIFYRPKVAEPLSDLDQDEPDPPIRDEHMSHMDVSSVEFTFLSSNFSAEQSHPAIDLGIGPANPSKLDYIQEGWRRVKDKSLQLGSDLNQHIHVERVKFIPDLDEDDQRWYSIDGDHYEVKPIDIRLLRRRLTFLTPPVSAGQT